MAEDQIVFGRPNRIRGEVHGIPNRDRVVNRKTGLTAKAGELKDATLLSATEERDTAKAELAEIKQRLDLAGLNLDDLPPALPGAPGNEPEKKVARADAKEDRTGLPPLEPNNQSLKIETKAEEEARLETARKVNADADAKRADEARKAKEKAEKEKEKDGK